MTEDIRWQQRFDNYESAFLRLNNTFKQQKEFNDLEKEGVIQRFKYVFELAWKTLKDYIEYVGLDLQEKSPRAIIKQSFKANIIADGGEWIEMLLDRNLLTHTYDSDIFEKVYIKIKNTYVLAFEKLYVYLKGKINVGLLKVYFFLQKSNIFSMQDKFIKK